MAKQTFLELTNRVLNRINQTEISDVSTVSGGSHANIIVDLINEAQNLLFTESNWYSLYATRLFKTVVYNAATIAFNDANPDTITDSANGFGDFQDGMQVLVSGSTSNDGTYTVDTAAAGTLTLQSTDALTAEAASASITITAITYPVASNWGRTIDLIDTTNDRLILEDNMRSFDESDPNQSTASTILSYALQGEAYRFHFIPAGVYKVRERYWSVPATLTANTDTSGLPIECENCLINYAYFRILEYMNKFELADRTRLEYERILKKAKAASKRKINLLNVMQSGRIGAFSNLTPPRFPSNYGRNF